MAELPKAYFPSDRVGENSVEPQFISSLHYNGNPHGVQNVGMFQPNTQNVMQTFPHDRPPPIQQRGFPGADVTNSVGSGPNMPPYMHYPPWPPNWQAPPVPGYHLGVAPGGVGSHEGSGAVIIPFDRSVPPPLPPVTAPPPRQQCLPGLAGGDRASAFEASTSPEEHDQKWIDSWLLQRPRQAPSHPASVERPKKKTKVWEMKQSLQSSLSLLRDLERLEGELRTGRDDMGETEWERKFAEVERKKSMLSTSLGLLDKGVLSSMRLALIKRGRKRARLRGRRALDKELVAVRVERRRRLHLEADMWLEGKQAEVDLHKREEMMKQEADAVLWEVRRKQSEGRRILSLLSALVKLHQVRVRKNDPASDPALSENEDQFQVIIDKLSGLWERQMSDYEAEERALRVILKESPEGVGARGRHKATGDLQRSLRLWDLLLFGSGSMSQELLSLGADSCQWLYLLPSKSLDALIENRRQWDQFISNSPLSSSIPVGWVIPAEASSEEWKALIGSHRDFG